MGDMRPVRYLCPLFCTLPDPPASLGFRIDSKGRLYGAYEAFEHLACSPEDLVTLEDLLTTPPDTKKRRSLTDEERYLLAITLASSLLQLHATPWLGGSWCKQHILFSEVCEGEFTVVDVRHPVILQTYGCVPLDGGTQAEPAVAHGFADLLKDSASLLTLAKVLLEIKLNACFETQKADTEKNEATDIQTLMRWMTEEKGNLSFTYRDAVSHCIKCSVDPSTNLQDLLFRQALVDKVVVPLLEELHYWQGGVSS